MELIVSLSFFLCGFIAGYFRGVISGYHTKVREQDKSNILNVKVYKEGSTYLYYDLAFNKFLGQHKDFHEGLDKIREEYDDKKIILSLDESVDVESV